MRVVLLGAVLLAAGCEADRKKVKAILEVEGCTDVEFLPIKIFSGCSDDDSFQNQFRCRRGPDRREVRGVVCSGWLKGATVRWEVP